MPAESEFGTRAAIGFFYRAGWRLMEVHVHEFFFEFPFGLSCTKKLYRMAKSTVYSQIRTCKLAGTVTIAYTYKTTSFFTP